MTTIEVGDPFLIPNLCIFGSYGDPVAAKTGWRGHPEVESIRFQVLEGASLRSQKPLLSSNLETNLAAKTYFFGRKA
jgi:hypothetical protein